MQGTTWDAVAEFYFILLNEMNQTTFDSFLILTCMQEKSARATPCFTFSHFHKHPPRRCLLKPHSSTARHTAAGFFFSLGYQLLIKEYFSVTHHHEHILLPLKEPSLVSVIKHITSRRRSFTWKVQRGDPGLHPSSPAGTSVLRGCAAGTAWGFFKPKIHFLFKALSKSAFQSAGSEKETHIWSLIVTKKRVLCSFVQHLKNWGFFPPLTSKKYIFSLFCSFCKLHLFSLWWCKHPSGVQMFVLSIFPRIKVKKEKSIVLQAGSHERLASPCY